MIGNGEVTTPYGILVPDPEQASSGEAAPDTKRTPELEMLPNTAKVPSASGPDTVNDTHASSSNISSLISSIVANTAPIPPMHPSLHPMQSAPIFVSSTPSDPALVAAHALLVAAARIAQQGAPASTDGLVYTPALGAVPPGPLATFVATFATTPAQRLYVLVTTAAMAIMATLIVVLLFGRAEARFARAKSAAGAPADGGATASALTPATTPAVVCTPATPAAPPAVAESEPIELPDAQPPVVRNARRGTVRSTSSAPPRR